MGQWDSVGCHRKNLCHNLYHIAYCERSGLVPQYIVWSLESGVERVCSITYCLYLKMLLHWCDVQWDVTEIILSLNHYHIA